MQSDPLVSGNADESLALSPDGKYVRRKRKYERLSAAELGFCKATKAVQISLQFAAGSKHAGVMVPADVRYGLKPMKPMIVGSALLLVSMGSQRMQYVTRQLKCSSFTSAVWLLLTHARAAVLLAPTLTHISIGDLGVVETGSKEAVAHCQHKCAC